VRRQGNRRNVDAPRPQIADERKSVLFRHREIQHDHVRRLRDDQRPCLVDGRRRDHSGTKLRQAIPQHLQGFVVVVNDEHSCISQVGRVVVP
jgi:hypothetical protein